MIRIALVGYGKMGKLIEKLAIEQGDEIVLALDENNNSHGAGITRSAFEQVDVAIDFSKPEAAVENVAALARIGVNMVIGTTGWHAHLTHVHELVESSGIGLVYSPNFSIGVNVFVKIVHEAAKLLRNQPGYEAWAYEVHHSAKIDAPSGTLLKLVDEMKSAGYAGRIDVSSTRAGSHPGTHVIGFDSMADTLEFKHTARSREGFASGALVAARWIVGKKGFHPFESVLFGD
jgi:4-hydroxy-tetrahydrodipicolinate reductase